MLKSVIEFRRLKKEMKRKRKAEKEGASEDTGVPDIDPAAYGYVMLFYDFMTCKLLPTYFYTYAK